MSDRSDIPRMETILMYIDDLFEIIARHSGIDATLADREGQYAIMMCLIQIGETLGKMESPHIREELPIRLASDLRNVIVHTYEGTDFDAIRRTVATHLPQLKQQITNLLTQ